MARFRTFPSEDPAPERLARRHLPAPLGSVTDFGADFSDLLIELADAGVEFMVVGGWAMAHHGHARGTDDLDVWIRAESGNARRVIQALTRFGAPLATHGVDVTTFEQPGFGYRFGIKPQLAEILTSISGVTFDEAWPEHVTLELQGRKVPVLGRGALRKNKVAAGRPKDLSDVAWLDRSESKPE